MDFLWLPWGNWIDTNPAFKGKIYISDTHREKLKRRIFFQNKLLFKSLNVTHLKP